MEDMPRVSQQGLCHTLLQALHEVAAPCPQCPVPRVRVPISCPPRPPPALLHCPSPPSPPANLPAITKPGNIHLPLGSLLSRPDIQICFPLSLWITVTPFYGLDSSFSGPLLAACCLLLFAYPEVNLSEGLAAAFLRSARSQVLWQCLINHLSFRQRVMRLHVPILNSIYWSTVNKSVKIALKDL